MLQEKTFAAGEVNLQLPRTPVLPLQHPWSCCMAELGAGKNTYRLFPP